jgi:hypothetical protein
MHVHLLVPDLLIPGPPAPAVAAAMPLAPTLPAPTALETLLAKGRRSVVPAASLESWLTERYGLGEAGATAAFSLLGDGGEPGAARWLRADPVHLRAERDALVLADASVFALPADDARALTDSLNRHFAPAIRFDPVVPTRWYAQLDAAGSLPISLRWTTLAVARGRPLIDSMPQGEGAMRWNALVNELQMLLHDHPVNAAREARGELPVNSVWLWGEGAGCAPAARPWSRVYADEPLARGLCMGSGGGAAPLPDHAAALLSQTTDSGRVLVVLDALRAPAAYGDDEAWAARLADLERGWFAPLLSALRANRLGMLTLTCLGARGDTGERGGTGIETEVVRGDLRRFWRRAKPLGAYARAAQPSPP